MNNDTLLLTRWDTYQCGNTVIQVCPKNMEDYAAKVKTEQLELFGGAMIIITLWLLILTVYIIYSKKTIKNETK